MPTGSENISDDSSGPATELGSGGDRVNQAGLVKQCKTGNLSREDKLTMDSILKHYLSKKDDVPPVSVRGSACSMETCHRKNIGERYFAPKKGEKHLLAIL